MQMKEWTWDNLGDLPQDLDDVLSSDLFSLGSFDFDDDVCADLDILNSLIDDCPDARELRNHDCMWAGLCVNEKHERDSVRSEKVILPTPQKKRPVVAPTNARSLLLPPRPPPDRPDTPLSENELDYYLPALADMLEVLPTVGPTEITGQVCRPTPPTRSYTAPPNTDHCYFTTVIPDSTAEPVKTDCLGVQTPSDSEEEIDVETVVADPRKPTCRSSSSSSATGLPTTPSLLDRHQLQLTVATAMNSNKGRRGTTPRYVLDRTMEDSRTRAVTRKRRLSASDEFAGEFSRKSVKRKQYRRHKGGRSKRQRRMIVRHCGSSDSEMDSTERRSMHNNMERKRRVDLRNSFEDLRLLIPDVIDNEKAAKVVILNSGAQYCQELEHMESKLVVEKQELRYEQARLRDRVKFLRKRFRHLWNLHFGDSGFD